MMISVHKLVIIILSICLSMSCTNSISEKMNSMLQVFLGRWFTVFWIMVGAGATYLFGTYSKEIKSTLEYDQTTINLLGFYKDLGANVGVFSGLIAEVTPTWFVLVLGSMINFAGYFMIWLAVTKRIPKPEVWHMCFYIFIGANSQNFSNTGALVTCVKNFPESRGVVLGLLKGFVGLSGAIFTQFYLAIYGDDSKPLILLVAWLPTAVSIMFMHTIRPMKVVRQNNEIKVFYKFLFISIVLALFLMVMTLIQRQVAFSRAAYAGTSTVVCAMLFLPLFVTIKEELKSLNFKVEALCSNPTPEVIIEKPKAVESKTAGASPSSTSTTDKPRTSRFHSIIKKPKRGEDYTIPQALLSIDMLIIFAITLCGLGASLTAVDNLGQIGESLHYTEQHINTLVSLISIWNFFGRVFSGFVSEILLQKHHIPRPLVLSCVLFMAFNGYLLIAFPFSGSVYIASVLIGFSFGAQLPLVFATISELFGLKYFSTLFNCGQLASPLGSYLLNVKLTGYLYDIEAKKQLAETGKTLTKGTELICMGPTCYRMAFLVLAAVTCFGAVISLVLVFRTREFYRGDIYKMYRSEGETNEMREMLSPSAAPPQSN